MEKPSAVGKVLIYKSGKLPREAPPESTVPITIRIALQAVEEKKGDEAKKDVATRYARQNRRGPEKENYAACVSQNSITQDRGKKREFTRGGGRPLCNWRIKSFL